MICPKCDYKKIFDFTICPRCGYNLNEIAEKREILSRGNSVLKSEISSSPANTIQSNNNLELAEKYKKKMIFGFFWFIGGIIVTAVTYNAAASSPSGGRYFIAWGAILFGFFDMVRGFFGWVGQEQNEKPIENKTEWSCSECKSDISENDKICPNCGISLEENISQIK